MRWTKACAWSKRYSKQSFKRIATPRGAVEVSSQLTCQRNAQWHLDAQFRKSSGLSEPFETACHPQRWMFLGFSKGSQGSHAVSPSNLNILLCVHASCVDQRQFQRADSCSVSWMVKSCISPVFLQTVYCGVYS